METKKYTDFGLGFERTQLFKEHEAPMVRRQCALNAAQAFYGNNGIAYTATDLKALYKRFLNLIENGDEGFFEKLDKHLETKKKIESINV